MDSFRPSPESSVLFLNKKAMDNLKQNLHKEAFECLNEAEKLIKTNDLGNQMWAITMNNYGCYYKKTGKFQEALSCLNLALSKEKTILNDPVNKAATHLNISSIYSTLSIHESALQHGQKALKILKTAPDRSSNTLTTLIVAYHSVGIELEALFRQIEAMNMYKTGYELARDTFSETHPLAVSLKKNLNALVQANDPVPCARLSRISARKARSSNRRTSYRKTPSYVPQRENFPYIGEHLRNPSGSYAGNYKNVRIRPLRSEERDVEKVGFGSRKVVKGINRRKIENLQSLIEEIEGSFGKVGNGRLMQSSSIGVQVESWPSPPSNPAPIQSRWKKTRKAKKENFNSDVHLAEIKVKEAIREVENLRIQKSLLEIANDKKELIPIPARSKVEYTKSNLHTIYESKYEDQKESFILIQSFIRMWLKRELFKKQKAAVMRIQRFVRGFMVRKLFRRITNAVVYIQSVFRGHRVRKIYNFLLNNTN